MRRRTLISGLAAAPLAFAAASLSPSGATTGPFFPTHAAFGHRTLLRANRPAIGTRPLLIVLAQYSEFPAFDTFHPIQYYERLGFGAPSAPFSTSNPVNPASLREYFRENSNGRFSFERLGLVGPLALGALGADPGPETRAANILRRAAQASPQLFANLDANANGAVGFDELCVVIFENIPTLEPANRNNTAITVALDTTRSVSLRVHVAFGGPRTPFFQIAHELSHSLGTRDMYNTGAGNQNLTLMSSYSFFSDDQFTVHLDAYHKFALGWTEPQVSAARPGGSALVHEGANGALILWDPARQGAEYFLIERRRSSGGRRYDANFPGDGALIWRVQPGVDNGVAHLGAPNLTAGASGVWSSGQQTPTLRWANGDPVGITIGFQSQPDGAMRVSWGDAAQLRSPARHRRLFYGGNGVALVDSGLPLTGVFYGVTEDGLLHWYSYNGWGQAVGAACGAQCWAPNSGAAIGRGWGDALHVVGCGDGVILAVMPDGLLRWYQYVGDGEPDPTGSRGWRTNSGNAIGRGWEGIERLIVRPRAGRASSRLVLYAVERNGDLRWFSYAGDGAHDPAASQGWHPNSGNVIGRGWSNLRHAHGSADVIFTVDQAGDLHWYCYQGEGAPDPTGSLGWLPNSGSIIGNGWQNTQHVFGGVSDRGGGFAHILMAVSQNGDLRWFRYNGDGRPDRSATIGWDPRSGSTVGTQW